MKPVNCPSCYRDMKHVKDMLMRVHYREILKRKYRCECGKKLTVEERRYPGEQFEYYRTVEK